MTQYSQATMEQLREFAQLFHYIWTDMIGYN